MSLFEKYKTKKPAEFTGPVGVNYGTFQTAQTVHHRKQFRANTGEMEIAVPRDRAGEFEP